MPANRTDTNLDSCWMIIYADNNFQGRCKKLYGPARYPNMRIEGEDWHDDIDSCRIGPCAYVRCYVDELFENTLLWLLPGQELPRLSDFGFGDKIDSIEIFTQPPGPNDRGYAEFQKALAGQKVSAS